MAWPSRRLRWPFLAITLLTYSLALSCHLSDAARPPEIELEAIDSRYRFLMFPSGEVLLFGSRKLDPDDAVGTLQRAVGVSQEDRAADVVAVNMPDGRFAYGRVSQLVFLPESDELDLVERWQQTACPISSSCAWQTEKGDAGGRLVRLAFVDSKHARRDLFTYETDGRLLLHVYAAIRRSIYDLLSALTIFLIASGITSGLAFVIFSGRPTDGLDAA